MIKREGKQLDEVRTDNGGEFIGHEYTDACRTHGVVHETGPAYTPECQGLVERANSTIKRALYKVHHDTGLKYFWWPFLLMGVVQMLNMTVHSATGVSPLGLDKLVPLAVGDYVYVKLPKYDKERFDGYFAGFDNHHKATVIVAKWDSANYKAYQVHPNNIKLIKLRGTEGFPYNYIFPDRPAVALVQPGRSQLLYTARAAQPDRPINSDSYEWVYAYRAVN